ncbi:prepilin peptidase-dependent pilin [Obesumbacterium proteus]|uniref:prepilin peptidase-dependent pilin n=1 Tax=Obesumbacterium proteus TaxID=82983 RepID=UPI001F2327B1|nr:prepilin peptidase-dependent pilin [Obesumbacterium proteus]MCE9884518.1 prepilin peptidase-dependent pilin [Obesumbacterium proteus]MCE9917371.1 prepilin peptidase-dependent pilin [Obesumbacterium proteus]MCE9931337.1 prepilin peptidase-dependent pilin [Obesumbacterium proteus]MCG2875495.1 prepilin peptidase-dependent pilin [Obesumbacterium proteus]
MQQTIVPHLIAHHQSGFTLIELMVVIAIIAILSAAGIPAYQSYIQKAAMTDMLQAMMPYKTAIELCALEQGSLSECNIGASGIPQSKSTTYVSSLNVSQGVITAVGQQALKGLTASLTPQLDSANGDLIWQKNCQASGENSALVTACEQVLRFPSAGGAQ